MAPLNTPVHSLDSLYLRRKRGGVKDNGFRSKSVGLLHPVPLSLAAAGCAITDEEWSGVYPSSGLLCAPFPSTHPLQCLGSVVKRRRSGEDR